VHSIHWSDEMSTGVPALDNLHRDLFETMASTASSANEELKDSYSSLVRKVECAFLNEEKWLEEIAPALLKIHREQHAGVLRALHKAHRKVLEGDLDLGRHVAGDLLPQWYAVHVSTLEMALAILIQENPTNTTHVANLTGQRSEMYID
jgi:hemerythrin